MLSNENKLFVALEIQYFELRIFATRAISLPTRGFELVTRGFEFAARRFELVTRGFGLVTLVLLFHCFFLLNSNYKGFATFFNPSKFIT